MQNTTTNDIFFDDIEKFGRTVADYLIGLGCLNEKYHEICYYFAHKVCNNIEATKTVDLDEEAFTNIVSVTVIAESLFHDLHEKIPADSLALFTTTWRTLLFTDALGDTIEEIQENLEVFMERLYKTDNTMCKPCMSHLGPETCEGCQFAE